MSKQIVINLNSQSFSLSSWRNHLSLGSGFVFLSFSLSFYFFLQFALLPMIFASQICASQNQKCSLVLFFCVVCSRSFSLSFIDMLMLRVRFLLSARCGGRFVASVCICWCRPVARPTYQHEYVPSSVHTRINGFAFENKFHHFVPVPASVFRLILIFLLPVRYLLRWLIFRAVVRQ